MWIWVKYPEADLTPLQPAGPCGWGAAAALHHQSAFGPFCPEGREVSLRTTFTWSRGRGEGEERTPGGCTLPCNPLRHPAPWCPSYFIPPTSVVLLPQYEKAIYIQPAGLSKINGGRLLSHLRNPFHLCRRGESSFVLLWPLWAESWVSDLWFICLKDTGWVNSWECCSRRTKHT